MPESVSRVTQIVRRVLVDVDLSRSCRSCSTAFYDERAADLEAAAQILRDVHGYRVQLDQSVRQCVVNVQL